MRYLASLVRRIFRAAANMADALVAAVRGYRFQLLADLFRAVDGGAAVTIGYRKADGSESERVIEPAELRATEAGDIVVRAHDHQTGEDRTFRIDRITHYRLAA